MRACLRACAACAVCAACATSSGFGSIAKVIHSMHIGRYNAHFYATSSSRTVSNNNVLKLNDEKMELISFRPVGCRGEEGLVCVRSHRPLIKKGYVSLKHLFGGQSIYIYIYIYLYLQNVTLQKS